MKNFNLLLLGMVSVLSGQTQTANPNASQWQADARYLQQTVHRDYPFLFKKITAAQFDSAANKLYHDIPNLQPHEIVAGFARLVSLFIQASGISWRGT